MAILSKDQILSANDLKFDIVSVPEWGGEVRISTMTGTERDEYEQTIINGRGDDKKSTIKNIRALLVAYSIVDEEGNRMFSKDEIDDLGKKSVYALDRVFAAASKLSALSQADIEELAGN